MGKKFSAPAVAATGLRSVAYSRCLRAIPGARGTKLEGLEHAWTAQLRWAHHQDRSHDGCGRSHEEGVVGHHQISGNTAKRDRWRHERMPQSRQRAEICGRAMLFRGIYQ